MFSKSFISVMIVTSAFTLVFGQTPEAKKEKAAQGFAWTFEGGGSYLGVQTQEVSKKNFSKLGLREVRGVAVEKVIDNSPAQSAGLQDGDVIVKFNGEEITSTRKLTRLIGEVAPDHQARLTVLRGGGDEREITVTLGKRPAPKFENGAFSFGVPGQMGRMQIPPMTAMPPTGELPRVEALPSEPLTFGESYLFRTGSSRRIGIGITPLTKQLSEHFGVSDGVLVNNVRENSAAAKAGLKAGDIIVEADGKALKSELDLIRAIGDKKDESIELTIVRDRNRQTISVTPEEVKGDSDTLFEGFAPGRMRSIRPISPSAPASPIPLNQIYIPGRVL